MPQPSLCSRLLSLPNPLWLNLLLRLKKWLLLRLKQLLSLPLNRLLLRKYPWQSQPLSPSPNPSLRPVLLRRQHPRPSLSRNRHPLLNLWQNLPQSLPPWQRWPSLHPGPRLLP